MLEPTHAFLTGGTFSERKCILGMLFLLPWIKINFAVCPERLCCSICDIASKLGVLLPEMLQLHNTIASV